VPELLRLAAFTTDPAGGNPAGVWLGQALPPVAEMQRMAAEVGYSESAFLAPHPEGGPRAFTIRYYSPLAEVAFCGHATIAGGVALGERWGPGRFELSTTEGIVPVEVARDADGRPRATLTSVDPRVDDAPAGLVADALAALGWSQTDLDPALPPAVAYAGASHLVLPVRELATLAVLDYDFERLKALMIEAGLTTLQLIWRETATLFRARDPFPVGGVVEDPATGAAAAAFGAYLRSRGELTPPAGFTIRQGVEMGRASVIEVEVPGPIGGIRVSGTAVAMAV
jgi:PhzF family phenazine biosynthesis protein